MPAEQNCPFCKFESTKRIVASNEYAFAFLTNIPIVPGHLLISPLRHVETLEDMSSEEIAAIFALLEMVKTGLKAALGTEGFNFAWNEGKIAGQNVSHFHLHVVPRKNGDAGITEYEPRKFLYRPGSREESPNEELVAVANLIRSSI